MIPLLLPHAGARCAPRRPSLFRRVLRGPRRNPAVPEVAEPSPGAAVALAGSPVLGDRMISEVRAEYNGLPRRVPGAALAAEPLPTPEQMHAAYFGRPVYGQKCVADVLAAEQAGGLVA